MNDFLNMIGRALSLISLAAVLYLGFTTSAGAWALVLVLGVVVALAWSGRRSGRE